MKALALFPTELVPRPGESGWDEAVADMRAAGFGLWSEAQCIVRDLHNEERRKAIVAHRSYEGAELMTASWLRSWGHDEEQVAVILGLWRGGMPAVEARGVYYVPRHSLIEKAKFKMLEKMGRIGKGAAARAKSAEEDEP